MTRWTPAWTRKDDLMRAPLIGITVHVGQLARADGTVGWNFLVAASYSHAITAAGGMPLLIPTLGGDTGSPPDVLDHIDGLFLSGGGKIPGQLPATSKEEPTLREVNPERYDFETELVRAAWGRRVPLLGVCRGHQTIAEALGGKLLDLHASRGHRSHRQTEPPTQSTHAVRTAPGSRLAGWIGDRTEVNSFHRQAVQTTPPGWYPAAFSDDGWIEAMEVKKSGSFGLGLQFHPEWLIEEQPAFRAIFEAFVEAAKAFRSGT